MEIAFDPIKDSANINKHEISLDEAVRIDKSRQASPPIPTHTNSLTRSGWR
jgi:uncharacterized DUF497 family protein